MSQFPSRLSLIVPGLLTSIRGMEEADCLPDLPLLETLLARASHGSIPANGLAATLFHLFGIPCEQDRDIPTAALCRLADGGEPDDGFWLHADPVFLKADGDRLLLFDAAHLGVRQQDAQSLVAQFNRHFAEVGWQMEAPTPSRWYLRLPEPAGLQTSPLVDVVGRNIDSFLPRGPEAGRWHALFNEIQMLFHSAQANQQREADGLLPVNSLWLSGGGPLVRAEAAGFSRLSGDDPLVCGYAKLAGIDWQPLPDDAAGLCAQEGEQLVLYHHLQRPSLDGDPVGWGQAVGGFQGWLAPLLQGLRTGQLGSLVLYPCNGEGWQLSRSGWRRFWKRRRPFSCYLG